MTAIAWGPGFPQAWPADPVTGERLHWCPPPSNLSQANLRDCDGHFPGCVLVANPHGCVTSDCRRTAHRARQPWRWVPR